jgi:cyclophilin family peptidyl-prolyl cis-trans isomerase/HEAT repeat protein
VRSAARAGALAVLVLSALAAPLAAQDQVGDLAQLLSLEDRRAFDLASLRRAAQHPDALIRAQAAVAIGRIGDRAGTPLLVTLLSDPDSTVRLQAAFALGTLGDTTAAEELAQRLQAFPAVVTDSGRLEMVTALAKIGDPTAARALGGLLQRHPPGGSTDDAATALALLEAWRLGDLAPGPRLVEYIRSGSGLWRRNATYSAARLRLAGAGPAFLDAAGDADALTRAYAARGLTAALADSAHLSRDAFVSRLRVLVGDSDAQVRITALRSLATFHDSSLVGVAQAALVDRDPNAVVQAITTLGALGGSRAIALLDERFAQGTDFAVKHAALLALARAAPAQARAAGQAWRTNADWRLRATYAEALGSDTSAASRAVLAALAADGDARVVETALAAAAQAAPPRDPSVRALARARLAHPDPFVRAAAIGVLDGERDPSLAPDFEAAYRAAARDNVSDARLAAVQALIHLAARDAASDARVEREFLAAVPRSPDYLVRRLVADGFGWDRERRYWGDVYPVETGRGIEDYRDLARSLLLPALQGGALPRVAIETDQGTIGLVLYAADAPLTVQNFLRLVDRRYFDGSRWHRVVPNFVIQDGDPRGDGNGGPGWAIRDEINRQRYDRGAVGMALSGPDTGGSQFFITHSPQPHLDGGYTVFGHVTQGYDVLDRIVQGDRIRRIIRQ